MVQFILDHPVDTMLTFAGNMGPKRTSLSRKTSNATRKAKKRKTEEDDLSCKEGTTSGACAAVDQTTEEQERTRGTTSGACAAVDQTTEEQERTRRLSKDRERKARAREKESQQDRRSRQEYDRQSKVQRRHNETEAERSRRQSEDRERTTMSRENESDAERSRRQSENRERTTMSRENETDDQRSRRQGENRERMAAARQATANAQQNTSDENNSSDTNQTLNTLLQQGTWGNAAYHYNKDKDYAANIDLGRMSVICKYCHALRWSNERQSICCLNGKVNIPIIKDPPEPLVSLLNENSKHAKDFRKNIRKYNSAFQMTSFGCYRRITEKNFFPTFKVQGQVYHYIGSLLPEEGCDHNYLQIYFMGNSDEEAARRCEVVPVVDPSVVAELQHMLHENNNYINVFKTTLDHMNLTDHRVHIRAEDPPRGQHPGRFNAPTVNEIAVIMVGDEYGKRDILLQKRTNQLQRVCDTHRSYDPLQYPLLFVAGEDGYSTNLKQYDPSKKQNSTKNLSAMTFYAHRMMMREHSQNHLLKSGPLFQQFLVDMYAKIENERLLFVKNHQTNLRTEFYGLLQDMLSQDKESHEIGKPVILPSSFTGGPRYMHERTQDAMAYVRRHGRPDIFLTMTCSTAWKEIHDELFPGQASSERHDLIARVFRMKVKELMKLVHKEGVFGTISCYMYTIEWQKRGLPHVHILIWVNGGLHSSVVDNFISAEIPDPHDDPLLFELVKDKMIHGPCGPLNPNSPCMKDGRCTKDFPKDLIAETQTDVNGYPKYRRRAVNDGGHSFQLKIRGTGHEVVVDNRWVVPYCPLITKTFAAHINVEMCTSVKSIKYICKYIHKGSDAAVFALENIDKNDEVTRYQTGRYISTNEAAWRILDFPIHEHHPPVEHLSVHLEGGQRIYYNRENIQDRARDPPPSKLVAFFELCRENAFAKTLLYVNVPEYFTWDSSKKKWCARKQGKPVEGHPGVKRAETIGRVYTVNPIHFDCFCLRLLLHHVRGPTSFQDLKTVNGQLCETFQEACVRHGLVEDDAHWSSTLDDAATFVSPHRMRNLFAIMLVLCGIGQPLKLWDSYKEHLSEDVLHQARKAHRSQEVEFNDDIFNEALWRLQEQVLHLGGKELTTYGLPQPSNAQRERISRPMLRETNYNSDDLAAYVEANEPLLNSDQKKAYDVILNALNEDKGGLLFLDAPGGTGKTFLIQLLLSKIRQDGNIALAVASSGIAATLLPGGRTAHSTFKLPLNLTQRPTPMSTISKGTDEATVLKHCKMIVWDECSMSHRHALEHVDVTLQDLRGNNNIFGGVLVLLAGDFRQILPVIPRGTPADELSACLKSSYLWRYMQKLSLTINMRVQQTGDMSAGLFSSHLLEMGNGDLAKDDDGSVILPKHFAQMVSASHELQFAVYPDVETQFRNLTWLCERAILAPTNECVNTINFSLQNQLPGAEIVYKSIDTVIENSEAVEYPTEFLNSLNPSGLPPHTLKLKSGTPVMLLRNINPPKMCNGTRLVVKTLMPNIIEATILSGEGKGEHIFIPRIPLIPSDMPFEFKRLQFPIRPCFAMTINKAQGQTLKVVGLHLQTSCFAHGQLYVGCSRVGKSQNLYIYAPEGKTKNVVYPRALE